MNNVVFALLPQAESGSDSIFRLISTASPVVKFILLLLLAFSVISWAIIIFKLFEYRGAARNSQKFRDFFRKTKNLSEINQRAVKTSNNPLAQIFRGGFRELALQMGTPGEQRSVDDESIQRSLSMASTSEITRLERLNGFLATTASVTPFIGLLGTVWGIMDSFMEIGRAGNANLATVAPGIAEALIATALGLFAAIPAVIFYNLLLNKLKVLIALMEEFTMEFMNASGKL